MKKMTLDLEQLAVESFVTVYDAPRQGTVEAFESEGETDFGPSCRRCSFQLTCANTCANTCDDPSCAYTCPYTCDDATCYTCTNTTTGQQSLNDSQCGGSCFDTCGGTCPV